MPAVTLCEGLILKNTDTKYGCHDCGGVDRKLLKLLSCAVFSPFLSKAPKDIRGNPSPMKSHLHNFQSDSWYLFDSRAHCFCFLARSGKTNCFLKKSEWRSWLSVECRNIPRAINTVERARFQRNLRDICQPLSVWEHFQLKVIANARQIKQLPSKGSVWQTVWSD